MITVIGATGTHCGDVARALPAIDGASSDDLGRAVPRVLQQPPDTIGATLPVTGDA